MSEKSQNPHESPAEQLKAIFDAFRETKPASPDTFRDMEKRFQGLAQRFPAPAEENYPGIHTSALLRHAGDAEDGVLLRVESDPQGVLRRGTSYEGSPAILLSLQQEKDDSKQPQGNKVGSWAMDVSLFLRADSVLANATGTIKTGPGNRDVEQLAGCEPQQLYPGSEELFNWIEKQLEPQDSLEPVPAEPSS